MDVLVTERNNPSRDPVAALAMRGTCFVMGSPHRACTFSQ
jgi:hypothetical protein